MRFCATLMMLVFGIVAVSGSESDSTYGEWTSDLRATIAANYVQMKADNPNIADMDTMIKSAVAGIIQDKLVIDSKAIIHLAGDAKTVYAVVDSWSENDSGVRFVRTKSINGLGQESFKTFVFSVVRGNLRVYDITASRVMTKLYADGAGSGRNEDVLSFLETFRKFEAVYQADSYDDDDGNGVGNYCFNADLLFGAAMGDAKAIAFLKGLDPDLKRKGQFQYKALVNDGWRVTVISEGTGNNAREAGYKVSISKGNRVIVALATGKPTINEKSDGTSPKK